MAAAGKRAIAKENDVRICLFECQLAAIKGHCLRILYEQHVAGFLLRMGW